MEVVLGILPFGGVGLVAAHSFQALAGCCYFLLLLSLLYPCFPSSLPQPLSSYLSPEQAGLSETDISRLKALWRGGWVPDFNWAPSGGGALSLGLAQSLPASDAVRKANSLRAQEHGALGTR